MNSFAQNIEVLIKEVENAMKGANQWAERFNAEIQLAKELILHNPNNKEEWEELITRAITTAKILLSQGQPPEHAVTEAELILAPIGEVAKQYTVHCIGHAHIDMNWMWSWQETVSVSHDTFNTINKLMDEFPDFKFSQSQTSVYQLAKDYLPEVYEMIKSRVKEGRWEITANHWVEGDKNMASGEILCRHILYSKRFFKDEFGIPYSALKIDWEPDTFGHCATLPTILNQAGIKYYYFCRSGLGPHLFWWEGKDGSRVLAFDDKYHFYLQRIRPENIDTLLKFEKETGLKDIMVVFGVGDHGGGPTRKDLAYVQLLNSWPIFPNFRTNTVEGYFQLAEQNCKDLPVVKGEMNCIFEGCYSSETNIKYANRKSENELVSAEYAALLSRALTGMPYPSDVLKLGWRCAMFNQFHDILPGSGIRDTYHYAQGMFQETMAGTTSIKTRAYRRIADKVPTNKCCPQDICKEQSACDDWGFGGGHGDLSHASALSRYGASSAACAPFVVFNPSPYQRSDIVNVRVWDKDWHDNVIAVADENGNIIPAQVTERGNFWAHNYIGIAFPAANIGGLGYKTYCVHKNVEPGQAEGVIVDPKGSIENEFIKAKIDFSSGALESIIDKQTGVELVPENGKVGLLEYQIEAPHKMTAWVLGQVQKRVRFNEGAVVQIAQKGPYTGGFQIKHAYGDNVFNINISLDSGSRRLKFDLDINWYERGTPEKGIPALRMLFPVNVIKGKATYEIANGYVERSTKPEELTSYSYALLGPGGHSSFADDVPAQKWIDLTGQVDGINEPVGVVLLNDCKYGYRIEDNVMSVTLIRSSYDPDPLPEIGNHKISFGYEPHIGDWTPSMSARLGFDFNQPLSAVSANLHDGELPLSKSLVQLMTPNVMISGIKKAEEGDGIIIRLYEIEGKQTRAKVSIDETLCNPNAPTVQTDIVEQPLASNSARMDNGMLSVDIQPFGMVTVKIG